MEQIPRQYAEPEATFIHEIPTAMRTRKTILDSIGEALDVILKESAEQIKLQTELARLQVERLKQQQEQQMQEK